MGQLPQDVSFSLKVILFQARGESLVENTPGDKHEKKSRKM